MSAVLSSAINAAIDAAIAARTAAEPKRDYLGASRIGHGCERRLAYEYHKVKGEPFTGRSIRRFRMGHICEPETADWMRLAGFLLETHDIAGEQMGFMYLDGDYGGHIDGTIYRSPVDLGVPMPLLWEHKIMRASAWRRCVANGVRREQFTYFAQAQVYMDNMSLDNCLFTTLNSDTSELHFELIPLNQGIADILGEKANRILEAKTPEELPRAAHVQTDMICRFCPFKARCWGVPATYGVKPTWMKEAA